MQELNYEKIQAETKRPTRLCNHCGMCMPILEVKHLKDEWFSPHAIRGPVGIWDDYPENCGYSGWIFWEREKQKHLVRKVKEELYALSFFSDEMLVAKDETAKQKRERLAKQISHWDKHGGQNW